MKTKWMMTLMIAAAPVWASTHTALAAEGSRAVSADIKGFGRDGVWREDGWHSLRAGRADDKSGSTVVASTPAVQAPELAAGVAASGLALLVGGLAVARARRRPD